MERNRAGKAGVDMELIEWKSKLHSFYAFLQKWKYVWIVLFVGLFLMLTGGRENKTAERPEQGIDTVFSLQEFEQQLGNCLAKIEGIGSVELMLSLDSSGRAEYASDLRRTADESYESEVTTVSNGSYGEEPVMVAAICPEFRGAVVICEGADNDYVRLSVTEAVGSICGIGADRIAVVKMGH